MKQLTKIASACLALAALSAQPALAARTNGNSTGASQEDGRAQSGAKRYCINVIPDTGSRMTKKVCRTKAEWADEGVELKN